MHWSDEGYLLSKNNFDENSIIIEAFTLKHGKYTGIVYGGSSRKQKKNFQIGNKILINWHSKSENKLGYFNIELIKPVSPLFFDNKKKTICILAASTILRILLPERQINTKIYNSFENLINKFDTVEWMKFYVLWEISLIKELGFEFHFLNKSNTNNNETNYVVKINNKSFKVPKVLTDNNVKFITDNDIKEALIFNKNLLIENFMTPNKLNVPISRSILEKYYD